MSCETITGQSVGASTSNDDGCSSRSGGSPVDQKPTLWQVNGQQPSLNQKTAVLPPGTTTASANNDLSGDAEGVWSSDIDQAFQEALQIYPPCGRRKIILSDEGKMYGRNELIARYIKIRCGKTRTRKQVSSHIQVLARKKARELQTKFKHTVQDPQSKEKALQTLQSMSSAQIVSMSMAHQNHHKNALTNAQSGHQNNNNLGNGLSGHSNGNGLAHLPTTAQVAAAGLYGPASPFWQPPMSPSSGNSGIPSVPSSVAAAVAAAAAATHPFDMKFPHYARLPGVQSPGSAYISPHFGPLNGLTSPQSLMSSMVSMSRAGNHGNHLQDDQLNNDEVEDMESGSVQCEQGSISSAKLTLSGFTAYVEPSEDGRWPRVDLIKIPRYADEPLETINMEHIVDKYPETLKDLFEKGPKDMFFLVKCWANISFQLPHDINTALYAVDSFYDSSESFAINVSTKVCSFGKQVVEKVEVDTAEYDRTDQRYHFRSERSPMCDYMVKFIAELKKLNNEALMNSVLENFTVLQVVTNKDNRETLMVIAFMFEVSPEPESTCRIYRLVDKMPENSNNNLIDRSPK